MKFFHEVVKEEVATKQKYIDRIKLEIEQLSNGETFYNEIYDVVDELQYDYEDLRLSFSSTNTLRVGYDVPADQSIKDGVVGLIDALEPLMKAQGYIENLDRSNKNSAWYYFYYEKKIDGKQCTCIVAVYIGQSEHCEMVEKEVWRKDIEYEYICKDGE